MNENDLSATYSARHGHHLQTMTGAMSAQVIDLLARVDTAQAHAADLQAQLTAAETQRDEALHMQAETMKTVEQSGAEIERLKRFVEVAEKRFDSLMQEHLEYHKTATEREREHRNAARRKSKT